jgi:hypothetical protein
VVLHPVKVTVEGSSPPADVYWEYSQVVKAADSKSVVAALIGSNPITPTMDTLKKDLAILSICSLIYIYLCYDLFIPKHYSTILVIFPYSIIFSIVISFVLSKYMPLSKSEQKKQTRLEQKKQAKPL